MNKKSALFVGMYPDNVSKYRNVFFQNLIFAMADLGVDCTVISPIPITRYKKLLKLVPKKTTHITSKGNKVTVYYPHYISASSKQILFYNTEHLSEFFFERSIIKTVKEIDKKFDFVYGHFILYGGLAAIKAGNLLGIPSFFAYGECDFKSEVGNTYGIPKSKRLDGLKGIISVSTKNTNELRELGISNGVPVLTAPNAVDLSLFHPMDKNACRDKLGIDKDKFIVGFVGGFIDRKGDKRVLQAVNELDNVYVAFAGRGEDKPLGNRVVYCEAMDHDDIPLLLNAVDVFVLPTLAEGSCNAIAEAMACGLPVISSDLPFNDDVLTYNNSIRINPMSIDEIKSAIELLKNVSMRTDMAKKSLVTAEKLDISRRAKKILDFICENI